MNQQNNSQTRIQSNSTFNEGRNAEKRTARTWEKVRRSIQVSNAAARGVKAPKQYMAVQTVDMLSDRRVRQHRGEHHHAPLKAKKYPSKYEPHQGAGEIARRACRGW